MNKAIIIAVTVVICAGLAFWLLRDTFRKQEETETMYCGPDKTLPVKVFINPSQAYPVFAQDYTSRVEANLTVMDSIQRMTSPTVGGALGLESDVVTLRQDLSQESIRMEILMKSNFYAYNTRPCDSAVSRHYFEFLALMAQKTGELDKLSSSLTEKPAESTVGTDSVQTLTIVRDTAKIRQSLQYFKKSYHFIKEDNDPTLTPDMRSKLSKKDVLLVRPR
ncbi:hypothetical protein LZZ85_03800 [Terrimonas sp. NA20]|uniref:SIMPL domain-containing protein n=1 Tax=Terrimonas ginsenosidimutans TaxID=2908004 RepID=A0ABS9KM50_9BACT|nr:hypothetical protein [Terrimonas ginsenosidimutans]MCG2613385.1 hypothetical protein [Terrimonas ginsenosidimutans]